MSPWNGLLSPLILPLNPVLRLLLPILRKSTSCQYRCGFDCLRMAGVSVICCPTAQVTETQLPENMHVWGFFVGAFALMWHSMPPYVPPVSSSGLVRLSAWLSLLDPIFLGGLFDSWLRTDGGRSLSIVRLNFFLWVDWPGANTPWKPGL